MRNNFLPLSRPCISSEEILAVTEILRSGHLTTGPEVTEFEDRLARYIGMHIDAAALTSCTAGLYLSLLAHGIGRGDEVILPTWTFAATGHAVIWTGAKPVLCDIDEQSLNIDVGNLERLITPRAKVILPVHFAGYPCQIQEIAEIAKKHNLIIIEDAAHALGTKYNGKKIGNFGDATVFSFYATKNLTCGEGGMVISRNRKLIHKIRKLSYFGINKLAFNRYSGTGSWYYEIEEIGYKYNMDSIHAAIGLVQLKKLDRMNQRRRHIARLYRDGLDRRIRFTEDNQKHYHTYYIFPILVDKKLIKRNTFVEELKKRKIGASVHFIPLHKHPYYKKNISLDNEFPVADKVYEEIVSIPMFPGMSDSDVSYVIDNINNILKKRG